MQAIKMRHEITSLASHALEARRIENTDSGAKENHNLSPTAIGFLVPLFIVFLIGPFMCVYFVRRRQTSRRQPGNEPRQERASKTRKPADSRDEARKKLESATEISSLSSQTASTTSCVSDDCEKTACTEVISILEKECAICLSTLHSPAPPAPAKIQHHRNDSTNTTTTDTPSPNPESLYNLSPSSSLSIHETLEKPEQILRLKVCGHEFHEECLVSWCRIRKYSCPICRAAYYVVPEEKEKDAGQMVEERVVRERDMEEGNAGIRSDSAAMREEGRSQEMRR
ncbi:hypothetical protein BU24DRAFT_465568 [Aaosphaeria arxii CBS 175.79]|uniref:RING-type domain-containing protein n=1 Tax=Aaosphaeria arxii CBS 175.79 TaxID=1450172 RepID=A0A6A5XGD5_9PLEO|nr:uncharacterized protein BU24DRAFT_465568 [Aaosphaeria arxii CBS 175.79]KAF2011993.1 hypothetical protein BU24DRAFT_465568 [Aaosphaeria arxii CBS 175.79]